MQIEKSPEFKAGALAYLNNEPRDANASPAWRRGYQAAQVGNSVSALQERRAGRSIAAVQS